MVVAFGHKTTAVVCAIGQQSDLQPTSVSKVVAVILNSSEAVSQQQLMAATGLSERAVKYAVKRLVIDRLISEHANIGDLRRKTYYMEE